MVQLTTGTKYTGVSVEADAVYKFPVTVNQSIIHANLHAANLARNES